MTTIHKERAIGTAFFGVAFAVISSLAAIAYQAGTRDTQLAQVTELAHETKDQVEDLRDATTKLYQTVLRLHPEIP